MKQSEAWVLQAKSDLAAAQVVLKGNDASTYCQSIAKYQQAAEKSIKGMIAALNELGVSEVSISWSHTLRHEVNGLDALRRKKPDLDNASLETIDRLIRRHKTGIVKLCALAPQGSQGGTYVKNTEYPFSDASTAGWTAPAAVGSFALEDVKKARECAWPLHHSAAKFSSSLRRRK